MDRFYVLKNNIVQGDAMTKDLALSMIKSFQKAENIPADQSVFSMIKGEREEIQNIKNPLAGDDGSSNPSALILGADEFHWILKFVEGAEDVMDCTTGAEPYSSVFRHQLQALWTSFCLRHNLDVDTAPYDAGIRTIFDAVRKIIPADEPFEFKAFDLFMGEYLC